VVGAVEVIEVSMPVVVLIPNGTVIVVVGNTDGIPVVVGSGTSPPMPIWVVVVGSPPMPKGMVVVDRALSKRFVVIPGIKVVLSMPPIAGIGVVVARAIVVVPTAFVANAMEIQSARVTHVPLAARTILGLH
jgi:hypothetical protein